MRVALKNVYQLIISPQNYPFLLRQPFLFAAANGRNSGCAYISIRLELRNASNDSGSNRFARWIPLWATADMRWPNVDKIWSVRTCCFEWNVTCVSRVSRWHRWKRDYNETRAQAQWKLLSSWKTVEAFSMNISRTNFRKVPFTFTVALHHEDDNWKSFPLSLAHSFYLSLSLPLLFFGFVKQTRSSTEYSILFTQKSRR